MNTEDFSSTLNGKPVGFYELSNKNEIKIGLTNFGATLVSISTPDRDGVFKDIVLGYDDLKSYLNGQPFYGKVIGRYANRIANARFKLNGKPIELTRNTGKHQLHGGENGFHMQVWDVVKQNPEENALKLRYLSKAGEEGFPGNLEVDLSFELTDKNELILRFKATTDQPTHLNLTHHSFFNLKGEGAASAMDHVLKINADYFTPMDADSITTGEIFKVKGTPMDFTDFKALEKDIDADYEQLHFGKGYDHNYVLRKKNGELDCAAEIYDPESGRAMEVWTDQPGMQLYTGNWIDEADGGKNGRAYKKRSAVCLEPQAYPNTPNHPHFPQSLLNPGETYRHTIIYKFKTL